MILANVKIIRASNPLLQIDYSSIGCARITYSMQASVLKL